MYATKKALVFALFLGANTNASLIPIQAWKWSSYNQLHFGN